MLTDGELSNRVPECRRNFASVGVAEQIQMPSKEKQCQEKESEKKRQSTEWTEGTAIEAAQVGPQKVLLLTAAI